MLLHGFTLLVWAKIQLSVEAPFCCETISGEDQNGTLSPQQPCAFPCALQDLLHHGFVFASYVIIPGIIYDS